MENNDTTIQILRGIRDELVQLRSDTNQRFEALGERIDQTNSRLTQVEVRLSTELIAVAQAVNSVRDLLKESVVVAPKVAEHERRISALEEQVRRKGRH